MGYPFSHIRTNLYLRKSVLNVYAMKMILNNFINNKYKQEIKIIVESFSRFINRQLKGA